MEQENRNQQNAAPQVSIGDQIKVRREKLAQLQAEGMDPFAITRFVSTTTAQEIKDHFDEMEGKPVSIAGRLMSKRGMGKVSFCDLQDKTGRIQLYARKDEMDEAEYNRFKKYDIGDIVGVEGEIFRTQRGEMSVRAKKITLLSKSLLPLPEKFHGLTDKETRYRQRYVDLIVNPEVKRNFIIRSQFIKHLRDYLDNMGYIEVETPVLNTIAGGAAARPFITHHNTLDIDMYMRIATELPLKRLIVGGMDRVYEVGRIFRNEGMDPKHNPEFTTVELYQAYADFHDMMDIAEGVYTTFAQKYLGTYELNWMGETIDLTPGWPRLTMIDAVKQYVGVDFGTITDDAEAVAAAKAVGVELAEAAEKTWGQERQRQRNDRADDRTEKCDAEGFQQQIWHTVRTEREQKLCRRMEDAGENVARNLQSVAGGIADPDGRAGPCQQARNAKGCQHFPDPSLRRGGIGFENFFVHGRFLLTSGACAARG